MKKIVIVGFGSIGTRHAKNFASLGCSVAVVSRRKLAIEHPVFQTLEVAIAQFNPDLVFVCTETFDHITSLEVLAKNQFGGLVIVEKPLFHTSSVPWDSFKNLKIRVAYNLRFNPLIMQLKKELSGCGSVTSAVAYVGQYLPTWRPGTDYRKGYSAIKEKGGGVLLDLSHEIDYCRHLFGAFNSGFSLTEKLSNLEITSDDSVVIVSKNQSCAQLTIHLNYTDRITQRFLICHTNEATFKIDFIKKTFQKNDSLVDMSAGWDDPYIVMAKNILNSDGNGLTPFLEGVQINKMIDVLKLASAEKKWVQL